MSRSGLLELFEHLGRIIQQPKDEVSKKKTLCLRAEMVTLLITAVTLLVLFAVGAYFWQKPATDYSAKALPPPPNARSLFGEEAAAAHAEAERLTLAAQRREDLIREAGKADRSVLLEARKLGDSDLYERVLNGLIRVSDSDPKLLSLLSYVSQNELPVTTGLAQAALASWRRSPDRNGTARALHCAALSDDADLYRSAVETALQMWRELKLGDVSGVELRALFDGEFWVLSSRSRSSGAGFVLKRTLDDARRELEAAGARQ